MNITEEQKQEADRIVEKYKNNYILDHNIIGGGKPNRIQSAIQDRQSVLEVNNSVLEMLKIHGDLRTRLPIEDRIQSLTNQIDYLKTKI